MKVLILCLFPNIRIFLSELKFEMDNQTEKSLIVDWKLSHGEEDMKRFFKSVGPNSFSTFMFKGVSLCVAFHTCKHVFL